MEDLGGGRADAAEALGLAVAEDRAEVVLGGALGDGEGLREEDGALGVVAGGVVDELDGHELGVVVRCARSRRPSRARATRTRSASKQVSRRGVLLVHGEDGEVDDPVACARARAGRPRPSGRSRAWRSRRRPRRRGRWRGRRCSRAWCGKLGFSAWAALAIVSTSSRRRAGVLGGGVDGAVGLLAQAELLGGGLEAQPVGVGRDGGGARCRRGRRRRAPAAQ